LRFIIGTAEGDLKDFLTVLYYTGSRRNVIEELEESQVDFVAGVIYQAKPGERQTKKRRPPIPLDEQVREILERRRGKGKFFGRDMYMAYRKHLEDQGFEDRANPHIMRHTRATLMLMDGVSIYKVARRLGDTVATIEKTYAHAIVQDMADVGGDL
jgi:integrase